MALKSTVTRVETKTTRHFEFTASDVRRALGLPDDAIVYVHIPGGGDWSNCDLELDDRKQTLRAEAVTRNVSCE